MRMIRKASELLETKGIEKTPARVHILAAAMNSDIPLEATEVAAVIGDSAHLATVYRTLERFVKAGILERIDFQEGKFRYEYVRHHHHHAVCESCGKIENVEDAGIEEIESRVRRESGFLVRRHAIELFGICNTCQRKGNYVQ